MESKEKREGNSDGEQEPISKLVSTRVYFCIYEATYNRLKVYSYNDQINKAIGTIVGVIN